MFLYYCYYLLNYQNLQPTNIIQTLAKPHDPIGRIVFMKVFLFMFDHA